MILVASISAIIDREDIVPSALLLAGGSITLHGVPVDPGTLLMMGYLGRSPCCRRTGMHQISQDQRHRLDSATPAQWGALNARESDFDGAWRLVERHRRTTDAAQHDGPLMVAGFGAIILAAGMSSRMVDNKLLLPWTDGKPIVRHVVKKYVDSKVDHIVVVTGRDADLVKASLDDLPVTFLHNPDFATGEMLSSLQVGLARHSG